MKHILPFLALLLSSILVNAQCSETPQPRILLLGDSWAQFMNTDNTLNTALNRWGHSNATFYSNSVLSVNGTQTSDFLTPAKLSEIQSRLAQFPSIDFVHLSLGGNDVLGNWDTTYTAQQTDSLLDSVYARLVVLMDFIKQQRPGVQILWSGYCYPNFGEIIGELAVPSSQPFYSTWQGMSFPTFTQINGILNLYSDAMDTLAANDPQVNFVKSTGLMQHVYGQLTPLAVAPGGTYPPLAAPLPEGYPDYPSPKSSMRNYVFFRDCFHLSPGGFLALADRHMQKFYHQAMMQDTALIAEGGSRAGSSSSLSATSPQIQVGSANAEDWSAVLSFNTTLLPDTGISGANLYLRRATLSGSNPFANPAGVQVSVSRGAIGTSADVDANDHAAPTNASVSPCIFGSSAADGDWVRIELPAALLSYIGNDSITQFRISVPASSGLLSLSGTSDPDFAPILDLKYGPALTTGLASVDMQSGLGVYPNPTSGEVVITGNTSELQGIRILDLSGRILAEWRGNATRYSLEAYPAGMYILQLDTDAGMQTRRIVKR
jgi:GDSL-like Lipase/Acylhydrolase family/Secretion system C-terminal sorting domain